VLDGERPEGQHRIGNGGRECGAQGVDARLLILPELEFVVDRRPAALADFRVDQVDGEFMWASAGSNEPRGGFTGAKAGIADAAHWN